MTIYCESSAVTAWLLGQSRAGEIAAALDSANLIALSDLTLVECDRAILRAEMGRRLAMPDAARCRARLDALAAEWGVLHVDAGIIARARRPFPAEPIRSLDAIHLAFALRVWSQDREAVLLSVDARVRAAAVGLELPLLPA